jgi:hypothetical protein
MRVRRAVYLNTILTVNAVLLTALLWTQVSDRPLFADDASAQPSRRQGIPNAAEQRMRMVNGLDDLRQSVDGMSQLLESGKVRVEVTNLDEIELDIPEQKQR